jgi:hypothetical protein
MANMVTTEESSNGIEREGFGSREVERRHEVSASAMSAQATAEVQARYIMARQNPRDDDNVRVRLLKECRRPTFAKRAFYSVPRGNKPGRLTGTQNRIEGLSVRFAESAIRHMGNVLQSTRTVYDDDVKRMVTVSATDLETNACYSRDVIIEKTVERTDPKPGAVILAKRTNSAGKIVFIVQSTEDDLLMKESSLVSKRFRTEAIALLPADTIDECERQIVKTVMAEDARDPDAARKEIADGFASLNVMPSDLKSYLGHDLSQCSPVQLADLRGLFAAIRAGDLTWAEVATSKGPSPDADDGGKPDDKPAAATVGGKVAAAVAKRQPKAEKAEAAKAEPPKPVSVSAFVASAAEPAASAARDFVAEYDALKADILVAATAKDRAALKAASEKFDRLSAAWPEDLAKELLTYYGVVSGKGSKDYAAPADTPAPQPPKAAAQAPPAPQAQAKPDDPVCLTCGVAIQRGTAAVWLVGAKAWRHTTCAAPAPPAPPPSSPAPQAPTPSHGFGASRPETPTHDGREPPPGALADDKPASSKKPLPNPYLPPSQRGEDYDGPDEPFS